MLAMSTAPAQSTTMSISTTVIVTCVLLAGTELCLDAAEDAAEQFSPDEGMMKLVAIDAVAHVFHAPLTCESHQPS